MPFGRPVPRASTLAVALLLLTASCQGGMSCSSGSQPAGPRVYVSNEESNDISVIDGATDRVVATVFVGKRPRGLRLSPDGRTLFVAVSGSPKAPPGVDESSLPPPDRAADGIALVDVATLKLVKTLESGDDLESFDLTRSAAPGRTRRGGSSRCPQPSSSRGNGSSPESF
jgi:YVTN family beta-propeller protein